MTRSEDLVLLVLNQSSSCFNLAYPNAKISPPKRGDSDFMMRSNKLNSAVDMLFDQLRSKVDLHWERLQTEFKSLDPGGSGHIGREDFKVIYKTLSMVMIMLWRLYQWIMAWILIMLMIITDR